MNPDSKSDSSSTDANATGPSLPSSRFATTSWSMVMDASSDSDQQQDALARLCENYWYPLYAFVRRRGHDAVEAEDLTQSFFFELLEKNRIGKADLSRGRFRSFLLSSIDNFIKNEWRNKNAKKRGGEKSIVSLDFDQAERKFLQEPAISLTAEKVFERNWAIALLHQVLENVRRQYVDSGKELLFEALKGHITGDSNLPYAAIAENLQMKEGAVKVAVHRLRERYGQQLRLQIARTVEAPDQVDEELRSLFRALQTPS